MNKIKSLYEIVDLHAGSGNSTFIMEAVKINPKCRILYSCVALAQRNEKNYIDWFKSENGMMPSADDIPHFCAIGGLVVHNHHGLSVPLLIDNSCFRRSDLEGGIRRITNTINKAHEDYVHEHKVGWKIHIAKINSHKTLLIDFIESVWIMPFRKKLIEKVKNI